jgi:hypothetical protein
MLQKVKKKYFHLRELTDESGRMKSYRLTNELYGIVPSCEDNGLSA